MLISFCSELMKGYKAAELDSEDHPKSERSLWAQCQAVADMKFTFVVSCQQYGIDKRSGHHRAKDILKLMTRYAYNTLFMSCYWFYEHLFPSSIHTSHIQFMLCYGLFLLMLTDSKGLDFQRIDRSNFWGF